MATPSAKLAESLELLHKLQNTNGAAAIHSSYALLLRKAYWFVAQQVTCKAAGCAPFTALGLGPVNARRPSSTAEQCSRQPDQDEARCVHPDEREEYTM
jgi:hypothetical protein